jgi:hypothetical protein
MGLSEAGASARASDTATHKRPNQPEISVVPVPSRSVSPMRRCSRTACSRAAVVTLTYVYADSTAVLGPLATYAEPHCYDLCDAHGERLTAPRGWEIVRLAPDPAMLGPSSDDLEALADAVREAGRPHVPDPAAASAGGSAGGPQRAVAERGRRGHLWVIPALPGDDA